MVNEDRGVATLALKLRNLTVDEHTAIVGDLQKRGFLDHWQGIAFQPAPVREKIYPLTSAGAVVVRSVSPEYPPAGAGMAVAASTTAPAPRPAPAAAPPPAAAPAAPGPGSRARFKVAVLDFRPQSILPNDARVLVDLLGSALAPRQARFLVLERSQIEKVMTEVQFARSDNVDQTQQLQIGRLLAADFVIVGSLARIGSRYIIDAKIIDVATGETRRSSSAVRNSLDELVGW